MGESAGLLYGSNLRLGGFLDSVVGMGQLLCQDAMKGTLFSAVAVDRACMGPVMHPCRVNLFEKPCPRLWTTQEHHDLIIDNLH